MVDLQKLMNMGSLRSLLEIVEETDTRSLYREALVLSYCMDYKVLARGREEYDPIHALIDIYKSLIRNHPKFSHLFKESYE